MEKKVIKVNLGRLENIFGAVGTAMQHRFKSVKDSYWFERSVKRLGEIYKDLSEKKNAMLREYGKKDAKGELLSGTQGVQIEEIRQAEFNAKAKDLFEIEVEVEMFQVSLESLQGSGLTPVEISALVGILVQEPEDEEVKTA